MINKQKNIILLLIGFLLPVITHAAGLTVTPAKINLEMITSQEKNVSLEVENTSSGVNLYDVWLDDSYEIIKISPSSFTLESGEKKKITLTVKSAKELQLATTISIIGRPMGAQEFSLTPGIKVPLNLTIAAQQKKIITEYVLYAILGLIVLTVVIWMIVFIKLRFKKKIDN